MKAPHEVEPWATRLLRWIKYKLKRRDAKHIIKRGIQYNQPRDVYRRMYRDARYIDEHYNAKPNSYIAVYDINNIKTVKQPLTYDQITAITRKYYIAELARLAKKNKEQK